MGKKEHLRILQVLPALEMGGVETGTIALALYLKQQGHDPFVCSSGGRLTERLSSEAITHITLPVHSKNPWIMIRNIFRLRDVCRDYRIDLIHARSRAPAWTCLFTAYLADIPFVTTFHGTYNFKSYLKRLYNSIMVRGNGVIAISVFIRDHILQHYQHWLKGAVTVVHRGIDLTFFNRSQVSAEAQQALRQRWGISENAPMILCPGRLTRWKGQKTVIQAIALLHQQKKPCHGVFIGSAQGRHSYLNELKADIRRARLEDWFVIDETGPPMPVAYSLANVVVHASTDPEAFGRVIVEAQAMEVPVVASNIGAPMEIIEPGKTGFLHEAGHVGDLAQKITEALNMKPQQKKELCQKALEKVRAEYDQIHMFEKTIQVYRELL